MTTRIKITNENSGSGVALVVRYQENNETWPPKILNPGESIEVYVYEGHEYLIVEQNERA
jgi:hypothetical protein